MRVHMSYGTEGLCVDLPDRCNVQVIEPRWITKLRDAPSAVREALRAPIRLPALSASVKARDKVAIVFSDITRPVPNATLLASVLEQIAHVPKKNITLINALGTHRPQTQDELVSMLGEEIVREHRVVQHDGADRSNLLLLGTSSYGHPLWVNRLYAQATVCILTGVIEPHFFAGFSGGPKAVVPGIAGMQTILANHSPAMLASPHATWARTEGNPVWMELREMARMAGPAFLLNVCTDRQGAPTAVFAGDMIEAHARGVEFAREHTVCNVPQPFDIVVTSNAGYPLDQNLYQAVKGMSVAARVVRPGGHIIVAAECRSGVPEGSSYERILSGARNPAELDARLSSRTAVEPEQWQVQIQIAIQMKATVHVRSGFLSDAQIRRALLEPCHKIEETVAQLLRERGPDTTIGVLPSGPQTIPTLYEDACAAP